MSARTFGDDVGMSPRLRLVALLLAAVGVVAVAVVVTRPTVAFTPEPPRAPVYPDLVTLPLYDFLIGTDGDTCDENLRFTASIANVGDGALRLEARRANGSSEAWQVVQAFDEPDGEPSGVVTGANLVLGGHGHEHWHLKFGATYHLTAIDSEEELASRTKAGYCFFDHERLPDADATASPSAAVYLPASCGDKGSTQVDMGMSAGWSDPYFWQLEDQSVDITGFPDGRYRLRAVADPDGWLLESDETNNTTVATLDIGTTADGLRSVELVETDPAP
jgi:Lysyl oxidase